MTASERAAAIIDDGLVVLSRVNAMLQRLDQPAKIERKVIKLRIGGGAGDIREYFPNG